MEKFGSQKKRARTEPKNEFSAYECGRYGAVEETFDDGGSNMLRPICSYKVNLFINF